MSTAAGLILIPKWCRAAVANGRPSVSPSTSNRNPNWKRNRKWRPTALATSRPPMWIPSEPRLRAEATLVATAAVFEPLVIYPAAVRMRTCHYMPSKDALPAGGPYPLVLFGHGFGSLPEGYNMELLSAIAAEGYVVAAPEFPRTSRPTTPALPMRATPSRSPVT